MDWLTFISAVIGASLAGGGIGGIFYIGANRKLKFAEADRVASEEWRKLAERKLDIIREKDEKIDGLYSTIGELRQKIDDYSSEIARLKVFKCVEIGCDKRKPPFGAENIE